MRERVNIKVRKTEEGIEFLFIKEDGELIACGSNKNNSLAEAMKDFKESSGGNFHNFRYFLLEE